MASALDTQTKGTAVVVYNPLNIAREDVVEAKVTLPDGTKAVRVSGPDGKEVPAQMEDGKVLFVAKVPSVGYAVYDVEPAAEAMASSLKVNVAPADADVAAPVQTPVRPRWRTTATASPSTTTATFPASSTNR